MKPDDVIWHLKAKDGRDVEVQYRSHFFGSDRVCPHLEFHSFVVSETGYYSHFFGDIFAEEKPDIEKVRELAVKVLEEKYLPPQQVSLF